MLLLFSFGCCSFFFFGSLSLLSLSVRFQLACSACDSGLEQRSVCGPSCTRERLEVLKIVNFLLGPIFSSRV